MVSPRMIDIIINDQIRSICKVGLRSEMCAYIGMGSHGFVCMKTHSNHKYRLGPRGTRIALGGNCEGKSVEELNNNEYGK